MATTLEPMTVETIEAAFLSLPAADRGVLVERLLARLDANPEVDQAWLLEAQRRAAAAEADPSLWIPYEEAMARLQDEFR